VKKREGKGEEIGEGERVSAFVRMSLCARVLRVFVRTCVIG